MKGTIFWVKLPSNSTKDFIAKFQESMNNAISNNLDKDDKVLFTVGDVEIKCFNGNLIELSESERKELVDKLLK